MKKKLLTCMLACVMSVSLFGCSSTSNSTAREAKDGTYTATAQGFEKGDVKVTITVKDGKMTSLCGRKRGELVSEVLLWDKLSCTHSRECTPFRFSVCGILC